MKKKNKKKEIIGKIQRFDPKPNLGLTAEQIQQRNQQNLINVSNIKTSKSIGSILFKNIFTFFNTRK